MYIFGVNKGLFSCKYTAGGLCYVGHGMCMPFYWKKCPIYTLKKGILSLQSDMAGPVSDYLAGLLN